MCSNTIDAYGAIVDFREVKDVEHMVIVLATLKDDIAFFE